jgi:hypothetical protein
MLLSRLFHNTNKLLTSGVSLARINFLPAVYPDFPSIVDQLPLEFPSRRNSGGVPSKL